MISRIRRTNMSRFASVIAKRYSDPCGPECMRCHKIVDRWQICDDQPLNFFERDADWDEYYRAVEAATKAGFVLAAPPPGRPRTLARVQQQTFMRVLVQCHGADEIATVEMGTVEWTIPDATKLLCRQGYFDPNQHLENAIRGMKDTSREYEERERPLLVTVPR